jgi:hypothetical protein
LLSETSSLRTVVLSLAFCRDSSLLMPKNLLSLSWLLLCEVSCTPSITSELIADHAGLGAAHLAAADAHVVSLDDQFAGRIDFAALMPGLALSASPVLPKNPPPTRSPE